MGGKSKQTTNSSVRTDHRSHNETVSTVDNSNFLAEAGSTAISRVTGTVNMLDGGAIDKAFQFAGGVSEGVAGLVDKFTTAQAASNMALTNFAESKSADADSKLSNVAVFAIIAAAAAFGLPALARAFKGN